LCIILVEIRVIVACICVVEIVVVVHKLVEICERLCDYSIKLDEMQCVFSSRFIPIYMQSRRELCHNATIISTRCTSRRDLCGFSYPGAPWDLTNCASYVIRVKVATRTSISL
jgi:hypothetical protein